MARVKANDSTSALGYTCVKEDLGMQVLLEARELDFTALLWGGLAASFRRRLVWTIAHPLRVHWFSASSMGAFMHLASKERNMS